MHVFQRVHNHAVIGAVAGGLDHDVSIESQLSAKDFFLLSGQYEETMNKLYSSEHWKGTIDPIKEKMKKSMESGVTSYKLWIYEWESYLG